MANVDGVNPLPGPDLPTQLIGMMRHEVGDLLQTLYCTVAILQRRLPEDWEAERRFLGDLRRRAETCKDLMDLVRDFANPLSLCRNPVDLGVLVQEAADKAAHNFPNLSIRTSPAESTIVEGDVNRLSQLAQCLLRHACESAERFVDVGLCRIPHENRVQWSIRDDGPKVLPERLEIIFSPCYETRQGRLGIGMALAHRIAQMHGGELTASNGTDRGFEICVRLPTIAQAHTPPVEA
jgi:signal transduction histidine kinase